MKIDIGGIKVMEIKEVFEPVLNFIKSLQKKEKEQASKQAAKDRLKLVLMQDRASVSPDFFEMMKKEIIDVIKKYIEIDEEALEVELTRGIEEGLDGPALYANIPIKNVKPVAPKAEGSDDEEEDEIIEFVEQEETVMSEEEADAMADNILNNLENAIAEKKDEKEDVDVVEETKEVEETEPAEETKKEEVKEGKPKTSTRKKATTKTTAKTGKTTKSTTTSRTTKKKKTE